MQKRIIKADRKAYVKAADIQDFFIDGFENDPPRLEVKVRLNCERAAELDFRVEVWRRQSRIAVSTLAECPESAELLSIWITVPGLVEIDLLARRIDVRACCGDVHEPVRLSVALLQRLWHNAAGSNALPPFYSPDPANALHKQAVNFLTRDILQLPPTDLCKLMAENGSDKAGEWHNYTLYFDHLFAGFRESKFNLLEVGVGTNHTDVPSSMGINGVPGASLRAWRDYFSHANVYGADVDRRILFHEDRISTLFVDQTNPHSIDQMWRLLPAEPFAIIIDDGLHTFEANKNLLAASLGKLSPGGFYVIEDISLNRASFFLYHDLLWRTGLPAVLLPLPHRHNHVDNCLGIIHRPNSPR